jgi:hypothetical protein
MDVTLHEEATSKKSREIQQESKVVQPSSPSLKMKSQMIIGRNLMKGQVMSP